MSVSCVRIHVCFGHTHTHTDTPARLCLSDFRNGQSLKAKPPGGRRRIEKKKGLNGIHSGAFIELYTLNGILFHWLLFISSRGAGAAGLVWIQKGKKKQRKRMRRQEKLDLWNLR